MCCTARCKACCEHGASTTLMHLGCTVVVCQGAVAATRAVVFAWSLSWVLWPCRENAADPTFTALCWGALAAQFLFSDLLYQASATSVPRVQLLWPRSGRCVMCPEAMCLEDSCMAAPDTQSSAFKSQPLEAHSAQLRVGVVLRRSARRTGCAQRRWQ